MGALEVVLGGGVVTVAIDSSFLDSPKLSVVIVGGISDFSFNLYPT